MCVHTILEDVLLTHPAVGDAAVLPSAVDRAGGVLMAFIVPRRSASPRELIAWVAEQVSPYPRIRRVEFVDAINGSACACSNG